MGYDDVELLGDDDEDVTELLGDDLLGYGSVDDYDEGGLLGARRRRARAKRMLKRRGYTRDRGLILGLGTQTIGAGVTADHLASPQVPFRPKRIIITATGTGITLDNINVEDIKVGKNSQLVTAGPFPAAGFAATAFDIGIKFDTAVPGIDIVVSLTNLAAVEDATTTVGMFGYSAER